jgi:hypothetical protein
MSTGVSPTYPVRVEGRLDPELSRWLWLFKWLLVIPHYFVLAFLWIAFVILSVIAFVAILFTARYPRGIFDFNVGVMRWTWRVAFYAFGANGTDRYPPFTLAQTDYPADFGVDYPGKLSRGLVLVKWWLLAIPHYLVIALFLGGGTWAATSAADENVRSGLGLIGLLVFIAVVALLFTGRYPRGIFDLILGMQRWVLRVAAYAGLMTDRYPPFRLDLGGTEPGQMALEPEPAPAASQPPTTAARVVLLVFGSLAALVAAGLIAGGAATLVIDQTQRDAAGYLMSPERTYSTGTYALVSEDVRVDVGGIDVVRDLVGTIQVRAEGSEPLFVGIGPAAEVERYLAGVPYEEIRDVGRRDTTLFAGSAAPAAPEDQTFWVATASGADVQALRWELADGDWRAVVMDPEAARGVTAELSVGARVPDLDWLAAVLLAGGAVLLLAGGAMLFLGARSS